MNINELKQYVDKLYSTPSDINEHLKTLASYAAKSESIVEFGVRGIVSTWALLSGQPKKMTSYDIVHPSQLGSDIEIVYQTAKNIGVDYKFILGDTLKINIEESDLLFIDTLHCYNQLRQELANHSNKISQYIIFHDTVSFGLRDERGSDCGCDGKGLLLAIKEFLEKNSEWYILENIKNNNGLMVLSKKKEKI